MGDYERIAQAIDYISSHVNEQPSLEDIAAQLNLSPYNFQRLFKRWAGVSAKCFLQTLTVKHVKALLKESKSILETTNNAGRC